MNVVVYTTPTCGYCYQAKEFLSRQGVPFVEKNVAADRQAAAEMVRVSGQQGVPVITVDGQVVVGFNQPKLRQLLQQARRATPKLGAAIADASSQVQKHPGIPTQGAYIGRVRSGSPAQKAGLRPGDVILSLGGQAVARADDVHRLLGEMPKGLELSVSYVRSGQARDTLVRL
jgi:glutaredoxin-like YruB-family protein